MQSFEEFRELSKGANLVPVVEKLIADLETPVSVLARLADDENVFLLESVEAGERFGRYSFIGLNPRGVFTVEAGKAYITDAAGKRGLDAPEGPFMALRELLKGIRPAVVPGLPPLFGGAVGYLGYETVREFEALPEPKPGLEGPASAMLITDEMIIFDNVKHTMMLSVCVRPEEFGTPKEAYDHAVGRIGAIAERLRRPPVVAQSGSAEAPELVSNCGREAYMEMVKKARKHIYDGDIIQVVLSQKFTAETDIPPLQLYRALRLVNPSPYTFFLKIGKHILISSSPETLCKLDNGSAILRPIAGTRPRGRSQAEDIALSDELLRDEKERAEHLMLVDLARNDLGRVALPGSVQVKDFMTVERYSHVMHMVTTVEALLKEGCDAFDLVRSAFPAGTLSGAPKIRAMEIIRDLEPVPRGMYGGAAGYFSYTGNMDLAITIRTIILNGRKMEIQAGAGIVYDSDPASEYQETCNKAAAMLKSIRLAAADLEL
ncbi:MAG: anthranilate synthase component I [Lentisphaeria bacterium]|nr:anthranilate synthase component I [Lentisphaeria bacterium]